MIDHFLVFFKRILLISHQLITFAFQEKRQQLLNEIKTLCEAPFHQGLVEFYGAFYSPDSGQISIALEFMDGGSLADIIRVHKCIPEPILSLLVRNLLHVRNLFSLSQIFLLFF